MWVKIWYYYEYPIKQLSVFQQKKHFHFTWTVPKLILTSNKCCHTICMPIFQSRDNFHFNFGETHILIFIGLWSASTPGCFSSFGETIEFLAQLPLYSQYKKLRNVILACPVLLTFSFQIVGCDITVSLPSVFTDF